MSQDDLVGLIRLHKTLLKVLTIGIDSAICTIGKSQKKNFLLRYHVKPSPKGAIKFPVSM